MTLYRVTIANNDGGGSLIDEWSYSDGIAVIESDDMVMNGVRLADNGTRGFHALHSHDLKLDNVVVTGHDGTALYTDLSDIDIQHGFFADNYDSYSSGGAMCLGGLTATMSNIIFAGNAASDCGGGIAGSLSSLIIDNASFRGNVAYGCGGGGMYTDYGYSNVDLQLTNVSFSDNNSYDHGGGGISGEESSEIAYCNACDNDPDNYYFVHDPDPTGANGNISVDPEYLDTTQASPLDWDFHLHPSSAMIDAGDPTRLDPDGSPSGIGAFGGPGADDFDLDWDGYPSWWQPGPYDYATYPAQGWDCDDLDPDVYPGNGC